MTIDPYEEPEPRPGETLTQWALRTTRLLPGHMAAWNGALKQDREGTEAKMRALPRLDRSEAYLRGAAAQYRGPVLVSSGDEHNPRSDARTMSEDGAL